MIDPEANAGLERRLRRLCAGIDAPAGFETRLRARLAHAAAPSPAERAALCARLEREQQALRARLARRLRGQLALAAGLGALAILAAWVLAPAIGRPLAALAAEGPTSPAAILTLLVSVGAIALTLRRSLPAAAGWPQGLGA